MAPFYVPVLAASLLSSVLLADGGLCPRSDLDSRRAGLAALGQQCRVDEDCINSVLPAELHLKRRRCHRGVCSDPLLLGERCSRNEECASGLCSALSTTELSVGKLTCQEAYTYADGSFCENDKYCRQTSFCSSGRCTPRLGKNEVCYDSRTKLVLQCAEGLVCPVASFSSSGAYTISCIPVPAPGDVGTPCSTRQPCKFTHFCGASGVCQRLLGEGALCTASSNCEPRHGCTAVTSLSSTNHVCKAYRSLAQWQGVFGSSRFCKLGLFKNGTVCDRPAALGMSCTADEECQSQAGGQLLMCDCTTTSSGQCVQVVPGECWSAAAEYYDYEPAKYSNDDKAIAAEEMRRWRAYMCCLQQHVPSHLKWNTELGRNDLESLGVECDEGDDGPQWVVAVIVVVLVVCCVCIALLWYLHARRARDRQEVNAASAGPAVDERTLPTSRPPLSETSRDVQSTRATPSVAGKRAPTTMSTAPPPSFPDHATSSHAPKEGSDRYFDDLQDQLHALQELRTHPLAAEGKVVRGVPMPLHRNFCVHFHDCPMLDDPSHQQIFLHQCPLGTRCDLIEDPGHCLAFWHVLPMCPRDRGAGTCPDEGSNPNHERQYRHTCPNGVECSAAGQPVHQQLKRHAQPVPRDSPSPTRPPPTPSAGALSPGSAAHRSPTAASPSEGEAGWLTPTRTYTPPDNNLSAPRTLRSNSPVNGRHSASTPRGPPNPILTMFPHL